MATFTVLTLLTSLFSVGWFGVLAIAEAGLAGSNPLLWFVGLFLGSLSFGIFVTALREGGATDLLATLRRLRH